MKIALTKILLSTFACLFLSNATAQKSQMMKKEIKQKLDSLQKKNGFPGVTFCAVLPNDVRILSAAGTADRQKSKAMKVSHRMMSGSNGKTLFIAAALQMASENYFQLDDRISAYLNDEFWFHRLPNASQITMRMLMNHTSGLEEYYGLGDFMQLVQANPKRNFTPLETFSYLFDRKPLFEAGTSWGYADTNFILLGYILEKIGGKKMYDRVQENILKPYRLYRTEPSLKMEFDQLATGYSRKGTAFPFHGEMVKDGQLVFNPQFEWMGGGFISQVKDLAIWSKALYRFGKMSDEMLQEMRKKIPAATGPDHAYGLGIQIRPSQKLGDSFGHSGWFPGYLTDAVYFPEHDLALAIQFNTDDLSELKMTPYDYLLLMAETLLKYNTTTPLKIRSL